MQVRQVDLKVKLPSKEPASQPQGLVNSDLKGVKVSVELLVGLDNFYHSGFVTSQLECQHRGLLNI